MHVTTSRSLSICWFGLIAGFTQDCASSRSQEPTHRVSAPTLETVYSLPDGGEVVRLSPVVFVAVTQPWAANSLIVELTDGTLVLVDTPVTPAATDALLNWMRNTFSERRIVAINSHYHVDCLGGNEVLAANGIEIIASDMTASLLAERGPSMMEQVAKSFESQPVLQEQIRATKLTGPATTFPIAAGKTLQFGDDIVRIIYPGPGHSPDNVVVHFQKQRVVFGGCLIKAGKQLGNVAEADLGNWSRAAQVVDTLDFDWIVPGHGKRFSRSIVKSTIELTQASPGN